MSVPCTATGWLLTKLPRGTRLIDIVLYYVCKVFDCIMVRLCEIIALRRARLKVEPPVVARTLISLVKSLVERELRTSLLSQRFATPDVGFTDWRGFCSLAQV